MDAFFSCRSGHTVATPDQFLVFVGHLLPQEPYLDLPKNTGRDLQEVARAQKSTAGGLDGWAWNDIKSLPLPWFSGLAIILELIETTGIWPQGLLDAYIAMICKADGDSTPLGQRPLSVLPVVYRLSLRLGHLREWVEGGYLSRCLVLVMVFLQTWDYLIGFVRFIFLSIVRFVSGLNLLLGLVSHGVGWRYSPGLSSEHVFIVALYVPWCRLSLSCMLIISSVVLSVLVPCIFGLSVRMSLLVSVSFLALPSLFGRL